MSTRTITTGACFVAALMAAAWIGGVLMTGFILATILVTSAVFTIQRLPKFIRSFLIKHPVVANLLGTTVAAFAVGPSSVTGLITMSLVWLMIDMLQSMLSTKMNRLAL